MFYSRLDLCELSCLLSHGAMRQLVKQTNLSALVIVVDKGIGYPYCITWNEVCVCVFVRVN